MATVPCQASTITYSVVSTDTVGDAVSATAMFTLDNSGDLTLTLSNLESNEIDVGQAITGIKFNLSTLTGTASPSAETGDNITVNSKTSLTDNGVGALTDLWTASTSLPTVTLTALGSGQPKSIILGPETGGEYPDANGSIAGNSAHNPFVDGSATFTFTGLSGLTDRTISAILSSVQIGFGTAGNDYIPATVSSSTPEPASVMLFIGGGLGLLALKRRKRQV